MEQVVLHIGTNKTGTSAIQSFLHHNPQLLSENGILYPSTGRAHDTGHHLLAESLRTQPERAQEFRYRLLKEAKNHSTVILSSEAFRVYPPQPLAAMLQGIPTRVVVYLRPHMQFLSSWYREGIKSRNFSFTFPEFVEANAQPYFPWLSEWAYYFPLSVSVYDRRVMANNSVVHDFFQKLGHTKSIFSDIPHELEENPSISGNLLYIKREINQFLTESQAHDLIPEILYLSELDPSFRGAMSIDSDTAHAITRMSEPDVQKIAEAFNIDITDTSNPNHGSSTPDLDRLSSDLELIAHHSQARKFEISRLINKHLRHL